MAHLSQLQLVETAVKQRSVLKLFVSSFCRFPIHRSNLSYLSIFCLKKCFVLCVSMAQINMTAPPAPLLDNLQFKHHNSIGEYFLSLYFLNSSLNQHVRWPLLLFISLSRFRVHPLTKACLKVSTRVTTPLKLVVGTNTYDLLGVIFHCGATPENGHYTTMVRSARARSENGYAWLQTNDQHIAILSDELISKNCFGRRYRRGHNSLRPIVSTYSKYSSNK